MSARGELGESGLRHDDGLVDDDVVAVFEVEVVVVEVVDLVVVGAEELCAGEGVYKALFAVGVFDGNDALGDVVEVAACCREFACVEDEVGSFVVFGVDEIVGVALNAFDDAAAGSDYGVVLVLAEREVGTRQRCRQERRGSSWCRRYS